MSARGADARDVTSPSRRPRRAGGRRRGVSLAKPREITRKRAPGRPRSPQATALTKAIIARQLALARRTASAINRLLDRHINEHAAASLYRAIMSELRRRVLDLPEQLAARLAVETDPARVARLIETAIRDTLETLADDLAAGRVAGDDIPPPEPRATVRVCRTIAEARAQTLALGARWIDLKERIA